LTDSLLTRQYKISVIVFYLRHAASIKDVFQDRF